MIEEDSCRSVLKIYSNKLKASKTILFILSFLLVSHNHGSTRYNSVTLKAEMLCLPDYISKHTSKVYDIEEKPVELKPIILASIPFGNPLLPNCAVSHKGITSKFGKRYHPILKRYKHHDGVDIAAPHGANVYSTSYGTVVDVERQNKGYGNAITIRSGEYCIKYAHLSKIRIAKGDKVELGQIIGNVGSTGLSTGPHLHYEVLNKKGLMDPMKFINGRY